MGKRSTFEREARDYYRTFDSRAVAPLLPFLRKGTRFIEPCAGAGDLVRQLQGAGHECVLACDIEPQASTGLFDTTIIKMDAFDYRRAADVGYHQCEIITNTPWKRHILHAMIEHFRKQHPTWLLFDAEWPYTVQDKVAKKHKVPTVPQLLRHCSDIVAVGRCQWVENTDESAKDSVAWYRFDTGEYEHQKFHGKKG